MTEALERRSLPVSQARGALLASVVLTLVLFHVPYARVIGVPLVWLSTLVHELGHGLTAWLVGARFEQFVMYPDASGAASWSGNPGRIGRALIAAGGLVGPAVGATVCFLGARTGRGARVVLGGLSAISLVLLVLFVRGWFAPLFVLAVAGGLGAAARYGSAATSRLVLMFLGVQLALSVFSRGDYLFTPVARTGAGTMPSDVAHIAEALWLPYWFWGGLIGVVSVALIAVGLWVSVGPDAD